jgi:hypothetical protein
MSASDVPMRRGICRSCGRDDCKTKSKPLTMRYTCGCEGWVPRKGVRA